MAPLNAAAGGDNYICSVSSADRGVNYWRLILLCKYPMASKASKKQAGKTKKVSRTTSRKGAPVSSSAGKANSSIGIRPLGDRVVIRPLSEEEMGTTSAFGIIIPDTVSKEKPEQGVVVAIGTGKYDAGTRIPMEVSVGDRVVFSKYGYDEVKVGGTEYYVVSESNLLAIIKK